VNKTAFIAHWESHVADKRIHGTTRKQVIALFEEERAHLQRLPNSLFPGYQEAKRNVHRDSYSEVARSFCLSYYQSASQSEYATDIVFDDAKSFQRLYPHFLLRGIRSFQSLDFFAFSGQKAQCKRWQNCRKFCI
jgi:hypothetical protein